MEIYTSASPFETSLTLQPRNSFRDVSFSSYLNTAEENTIRKLTSQPNRKKPEEDEEIGVFGAEKYFKGEIEDENGKNDRRLIDPSNNTTRIRHQDHGIEEFDHGFHVKQKTDEISIHTPSVRSNASLNSRSGLLPPAKQASRRIEKGSRTRILLATFGCNCIDKKSTQISEKGFVQTKEISKSQSRMFDFDQRTESTEKNTRTDCFSFPVLNANDSNSNSNSVSSLNSRSRNLARKVHGDGNNGGRLSLGRKLSMLNDWEVEIPIDDEMCIPSSGMYNNNDDVDSDSSSDLFEIESFSTTGNSSFLAHRTSESNCYAPSEVSIDWSVVTASAADFSVASEYEIPVSTGGGGGWRNSGRKDEQKKRPGVLSGCTNHKAVRVAGDEYKVSGGGGGGGGGRRRSSESMAVGSVFRGVKNVTRFDRNYGSDVCPMTEPKLGHALQHLYIQQ